MRKNKLLSATAVFLLIGSLALSACSSSSAGSADSPGSAAASEASEAETVSIAGTVEAGTSTAAEDSTASTAAAESAATEMAAETISAESTDGTEAETETAGGETGTETASAESSWGEALQNMLMPMDALMMCAVEEEKSYDPADPEFFWGALFRELGNHSDASSLITTNENWELQVPRQVAQEFATGLFADYSDLLAVPDSLSSIIRYDESWDAYILSPGDRGLSAAEILSASETEDGGYDVTARLYDVTDSSDICVYLFHLVPNAYADGITDPLFLYSVESMSPQS